MDRPVNPSYREATAQDRVEGVVLAHLSIELGHLYMDDFRAGPDRLREMFAAVAPWVQAAKRRCAAEVTGKARISTCFLIDDYFTVFSSPREVIPQLMAAAGEAGLQLDYVARESACAVADRVPVAELVAARLVADPPPGTNGSRPPVQQTGWLCNGSRSPQTVVEEAMSAARTWQPPRENGAVNHSVFLDVELWRDTPAGRLYACAFLASVWQLLRLGLIRDNGVPVATAQPWDGGAFPDQWSALAPVTRLRPEAAAFAAYTTFSVLASRFLPVEHAVRTILSQVSTERALAAMVAERALGEKLTLSPEIVGRIRYAFD
ncbi:hypothetical protein F4553_005093 [Allocatelliglobosispora scoriae]|uniref:Uncharacterized protein n=1 Tax=Allocatelliglobosispora scoriae TaxID=643052 RepID=A0A841BU36_9ACTN|nr:SCO2522 family protein [Allocatelliglobosispora scoriae]MBB5871714.1 hypothetical protein [Allocatelliglobosispora scoriae]